jgi:peptide/nickel transport system permease protein
VIGFIIRRLVALVPLLLLISFVVFGLSLLIPGDPAQTLAGGTRADPAKVAEIRTQLHLDQPVYQQYGHWLGDVAHGDLGTSFLRNRTVAEEIRLRFPVTFSLALGALVLTILLGVPLGVIAGLRPGSTVDRIITFGTSAGLAAPDFWVAMILIGILAVQRQLLPSQGYVSFADSPVEWATHLYMPWIALGIPGAAGLARQLRGALADTLEQDYVRTARAKGLRGRMIVLKHALKNAALVPVTVVGLQFAYLLGGTVIIERIFSLPGMGQYFFDALTNKDLPVIQGVVLMSALIFVLVNLVVDVLYAYLNPKVRLQ